MKAKLLISLILSSCWLHSAEPPLAEWTLGLGRNAVDVIPSAVHELGDGGWLLAWHTDSGTEVTRVSSLGRALWEKTVWGMQGPSDFITRPNGELYLPGNVTGRFTAFSVSLDGLIKSTSIGFDSPQFSSFEPTPDGGGFLFSNQTSALTADRLDASLGRQWSVSVPDLPVLRARAADEGGFTVAYSSRKDNAPAMTILRVDSATKQIAWRKAFPSTEDTPKLFAMNDGVLVVTVSDRGGLKAGPISADDIWLIKLSRAGEPLWDMLIGGPRLDAFQDLVALPDGGCVVLGWSRSSPLQATSTTLTWPMDSEFFAARIGPMGTLEKLVRLAKADPRRGASRLFLHPSGGFIACLGYSEGSPPKHQSLLGLSDSLEVQWRVRLGDEPQQLRDFHASRNGGGLFLSQDTPFAPLGAKGFRTTATKIANLGLTWDDLVPPLSAAAGRPPHEGWAIPTRSGWRYTVETSPAMRPNSWTPLLKIDGDGLPFTFPGRTQPKAPREFFRVRVEPP